ncbi:heme-binding-like protein At3g10130 [Seminavis robusta]|uniref:Heme-binding-like protein At3g10130 n=1 Tax=Seminavis robusta TaxID=568900 RepID=A0A9N8HDK0_9STRA|nr:heme-binding-like protein At3g10130 [Seminavis robusta]|eukprot:Sro364_g127200.1 heme-binding-like protein At3g10130 (508) ;mRNA; f:53875-55558
MSPSKVLSLALAAASCLQSSVVFSYAPPLALAPSRPSPTFTSRPTTSALFSSSTTSSSSTKTTDAEFAAFAETLEEDVDVDEEDMDQTWQASVDELLDPLTPLARRQALLAKLVGANKDIQESVLTALRDRKIDGLLTPNGKKLQEGSQTVARQITNDILPNLAANPPPNPATLLPDPTDVSKVGSRILNALSNQVQKNIELLQGDLANPVRIPQRISRQTNDFVTEARNVFSETPVGLQEPPYTVVQTSGSYEIRDYEGYSVASTSMGKNTVILGADDNAAGTNLAETGAAFNTLAAYLFGANKEGVSMDMTTPVTTTSWGEMRFYLSRPNDVPAPLDDASSGSLYESGAVTILDIPPARLAVKKFTGFVTEGEITRQKDALLSALSMDDIEIDVAHGDPISHVIFQYNPPYTLPIVRRNEIAVAVRRENEVVDLKQQWGDKETAGGTTVKSAEEMEPVNGVTEESTMSAEEMEPVNGVVTEESTKTTASAEKAQVLEEEDISPSD